jgi:hypothetical protein
MIGGRGIDRFEAGRRRGICEALDAMMDFVRGGGDWIAIASTKDAAQAAEYELGEFDLRGFMEALVVEQEEIAAAEAGAGADLFGDSDD